MRVFDVDDDAVYKSDRMLFVKVDGDICQTQHERAWRDAHVC